MYVVESEGGREYTSVQGRPRVEIETTRFERSDKSQLGVIVDYRVVDAPNLVLDCRGDNGTAEDRFAWLIPG